MSYPAAYDEKIRSLMEECTRRSSARDSRAETSLSKLLKIADGMDDQGLRGFVYFHRANYHYLGAEYDAFHESLGHAIHALLRSEDHELLARTYNFFANEAYSKGALDIAYNYYMSALQFVRDSADSPVRGYLYVNLAGMFSILGDYAESRRYFKKGIALLKQNRQDPFYHRNMIAAYVIDGMNSIAMGDLKAAEKTYRAAGAIFRAADETLIQEAGFAYLIYEMRLALLKGEHEKVRTLMTALEQELAQEEAFHESMDELRELCRAMSDAGLQQEAGRILHAIDARLTPEDITHAMLKLTEMKVDYYERIGDRKNLMKSLNAQNELFLRSQKEQQELYHYSIGYIALVDELKEEEEHIRQENERLQERAMRDALCRIPNRYAMDKELERALEEAHRAHAKLGVGLIDANRFKEVNDTYGHRVGDKYLVMIGRTLARFAKKEQIFCARYGGDEFLIIYEDKRRDEVLRIATEIGGAIAEQRVRVHGAAIGNGVSISQGICYGVPSNPTRAWDYLTAADAALYKAKRSGDETGGVALFGLRGKVR